MYVCMYLYTHNVPYTPEPPLRTLNPSDLKTRKAHKPALKEFKGSGGSRACRGLKGLIGAYTGFRV